MPAHLKAKRAYRKPKREDPSAPSKVSAGRLRRSGSGVGDDQSTIAISEANKRNACSI
jgi:hypothetical protein